MLTKEENQAMEQISCVYETIKGIEDLMGDIVGKYDTLPEIRKNFVRLTEEYKGLVYNASEFETIEEKY